MDIKALKHTATVAQAIAGPRRILVFGSASLFGTFTSAEESLEPLRRSQDADFIVHPFDEATGRTLNDAIGADAEFAAQFGYHADIVRPFAIQNFPPDFESRLDLERMDTLRRQTPLTEAKRDQERLHLDVTHPDTIPTTGESPSGAHGSIP